MATLNINTLLRELKKGLKAEGINPATNPELTGKLFRELILKGKKAAEIAPSVLKSRVASTGVKPQELVRNLKNSIGKLPSGTEKQTIEMTGAVQKRIVGTIQKLLTDGKKGGSEAVKQKAKTVVADSMAKARAAKAAKDAAKKTARVTSEAKKAAAAKARAAKAAKDAGIKAGKLGPDGKPLGLGQKLGRYLKGGRNPKDFASLSKWGKVGAVAGSTVAPALTFAGISAIIDTILDSKNKTAADKLGTAALEARERSLNPQGMLDEALIPLLAQRAGGTGETTQQMMQSLQGSQGGGMGGLSPEMLMQIMQSQRGGQQTGNGEQLIGAM